MCSVRRLDGGLWLALGLVAVVLFLPAISIAQPPAGSGTLVIVSDEGQAQGLPSQVVYVDKAMLRADQSDPNPNWRNRDFNDSGWSDAFPVQRVGAWATLSLQDADHIWGGAPGPLVNDGIAGPAYPRRCQGGVCAYGYAVSASPVPQYLFLRKNFCIPINAQLGGNGKPAVSPGSLSLLTAIDGSATVWLNGLYSLWTGNGSETGSVNSIPMPPNIDGVFERGRNTLSIRASENDPTDQAALLYRWQIDYSVDSSAIQINASANPAHAGQSIDFSFTHNALSNRPPYSPIWDFGDSSGDTDSPHIYTAPGNYVVTLQLVDVNGCPGVAQMTIQVIEASGLQITKSANPTVANIGDVVQFDITVANTGSLQSLTGVVVTDTLPVSTTFFGCSDNCGLAGNAVVWNLGTLAPNETRPLWLRVQIAASAGAQVTNASYNASSAEGRFALGAPPIAVQINQPLPTPTDLPTATPVTPSPTGTFTPSPTGTFTPTPTPITPTPTRRQGGGGRPPSPTDTPVPMLTLTPPFLLPVTGGEMAVWPWVLAVSGLLMTGLAAHCRRR